MTVLKASYCPADHFIFRRYSCEYSGLLKLCILLLMSFFSNLWLEWLHALFIRTSNFWVRLGCSEFCGHFSLKLFLNCSYFLIFLNSELVTRNNTCKIALRDVFLLLFHPAKKKLETVNTASVMATSMLITLPVPNDQAKFWQVLFSIHLNPSRRIQ